MEEANSDNNDTAPDDTRELRENASMKDYNSTQQTEECGDQSRTSELEGDSSDADPQHRKETDEVKRKEEEENVGSDSGNDKVEKIAGKGEPVLEKHEDTAAAVAGRRDEQEHTKTSGNWHDTHDLQEREGQNANTTEMYIATNSADEDDASKTSELPLTHSGVSDGNDTSRSQEDVTAVDAKEVEGCQNSSEITGSVDENSVKETSQTLREKDDDDDDDDDLQANKHEQQDVTHAAEQTEDNLATDLNSRDDNTDDRNGEGHQERPTNEQDAIFDGGCDGGIAERFTVNNESVSEEDKDNHGAADAADAGAEGCQNNTEITSVAGKTDAANTGEQPILQSIAKDREDIGSESDKCEQDAAVQSAEQKELNSLTSATDNTDDAAEQHRESGQEQLREDLAHYDTDVNQSADDRHTLSEAESGITTACGSMDEQVTNLDAKELTSKERCSPENDAISSSSADNKQNTSGEIQPDDAAAEAVRSASGNDNIPEDEARKATESGNGDKMLDGNNVAGHDEGSKQEIPPAECAENNLERNGIAMLRASEQAETADENDSGEATDSENKSDAKREQKPTETSDEQRNSAVREVEMISTTTAADSTTGAVSTDDSQDADTRESEDKAEDMLSTVTDHDDENASSSPTAPHSGNRLLSFKKKSLSWRNIGKFPGGKYGCNNRPGVKRLREFSVGSVRENVSGDVWIHTQDYKSLRIAVVICRDIPWLTHRYTDTGYSF